MNTMAAMATNAAPVTGASHEVKVAPEEELKLSSSSVEGGVDVEAGVALLSAWLSSGACRDIAPHP